MTSRKDHPPGINLWQYANTLVNPILSTQTLIRVLVSGLHKDFIMLARLTQSSFLFWEGHADSPCSSLNPQHMAGFPFMARSHLVSSLLALNYQL